MQDQVPRRGALGLGLGLTALAAGLRRATAEPVPSAPPGVPDWTHDLGAPLVTPPYGVPAASEKDVVRRLWHRTSQPGIGVSVTPLQDLQGIITPAGLHYERHHAGVPTIDPDRHRLMVHGLVRRPLLFTMNDLLRLPSVSRIHFLECSGNSSQLWKDVPADATVQDTHGLLSCSEWTGVRLADLLDQAGVQPEARWMLAEGADSAAMTRSIPVAKAMDDAILAYAQNGERLRP
ncbi:MAG: molybdopterin-dependent oxidoreductase, partial [Janthinobacterium lividum]